MKPQWTEQVYRKREDIVSRAIAGETILVPIRQKLADMQQIFSLNPVAACLWEQLDGRKKVEEILSVVVDRFDVENEEAETDMKSFLEDLLKSGLIEAVD